MQDSTPSAGITQIRLCGYDLRLENEPPRVKDALFIYRKILFVKENNRCFDQIFRKARMQGLPLTFGFCEEPGDCKNEHDSVLKMSME